MLDRGWDDERILIDYKMEIGDFAQYVHACQSLDFCLWLEQQML